MQGILIAILVGVGSIPNAEDGRNLQNFIICCEMLPAAIMMFYAFPYNEYKVTGAWGGTPLLTLHETWRMPMTAERGADEHVSALS